MFNRLKTLIEAYNEDAKAIKILSQDFESLEETKARMHEITQAAINLSNATTINTDELN